MQKKEVLIIIAHPDDETIWMGGTLIRNRKRWNTTIFSLCRKNDTDRAPRFRKACEIYQAKCFISDLDDEHLQPLNLSEIKYRIEKFSDKKYDLIFTHGENGEYGHIRHKEIHEAVKQMFLKKILNTKKILFFSYLKKENDYQGYCICNSNANKLINLNSLEHSEKKKIITEIYGFEKGGFEEMSCNECESFTILN